MTLSGQILRLYRPAGAGNPECRRVNGSIAEGFPLKAARRFLVVAAGLVLVCSAAGIGQENTDGHGALGIFESQSDIGKVNPPGTVSFDPTSGVYTVASAGWDLWAANDAFHMVWKKVSGDVSLTADIQLAPASAASQPNRKAFLMFRQTLDPDSMYADAAVHGTGETALQERRSKGDTTQDIYFDLGAPKTVRLEKRGDTITLFVSMKGEPLHQAGASIKLHFAEPFYAGLGVCSHRDGASETGDVFACRAEAAGCAARITATMALYSTLQDDRRFDNNSRRAFVVLTGKGQMEAPNWTRDGKTLIFDRDGRLWTMPVTGGEPNADRYRRR